MKLTNDPQVILITGCSSGFGLITAARLAALNHRVIATMRDLSKREALFSEVKKRGGKVSLYALDVTKPASIKEVIEHIGAEFGYLDVLINNAGYGIGGFFEDLTEAEIRKQMETNFFGVQNVTREVIPLMRQRRRGKIINISSIAGLTASPCFSAYNASKWALEAFSESLFHELKLFNIDVILVEPGTYKTKIFYENARYAENFYNPQSPYYPFSQHLNKKVQDYLNDCFKDPEDVARVIERVINSDHPPFRVTPDSESLVLPLLRRFLPFRLYSWLYRRALFAGLDTNKI